MTIMRIILNTISIIITSGSMIAGGHNNVQDFNPNMRAAKALRIAARAQSIFLSITVFLPKSKGGLVVCLSCSQHRGERDQSIVANIFELNTRVCS
jgi:hypothetical protein